MSPNIYHLIDSAEFPFELWKIVDKAFGLQEIEYEAWSEPSISSYSLSQDLLASTFSDEVDHDEEVSHTIHVAATLFDSNASSFNQEANIEEPYFSVSLEGDFSCCDTIDEKEVTYGAAADIDIFYDPITHSLFSKYTILYSEIYVPDSSHLGHTSLIDGAQPSDFQDVCLDTSSFICVIPLTLLDIMCFSISSFFSWHQYSEPS